MTNTEKVQHRIGRTTPAQPTEKNPQDPHQKKENPQPENFQIAADETEHVVGDHVHPAEKNVRLTPVTIQDPAHFLDGGMPLAARLVAVVPKGGRDLLQGTRLVRSQPLAVRLFTQGVAPVSQLAPAAVWRELDHQRGGVQITAHQQVAVKGALLKFDPGQGFVGARIQQGAQAVGQLLDRHRWTFQKGDIENRHHRRYALDTRQIRLQGLEPL